MDDFFKGIFGALPSEDRAMLSAYMRDLFEHDASIPHLPNLDAQNQIEEIIESFKKGRVN